MRINIFLTAVIMVSSVVIQPGCSENKQAEFKITPREYTREEFNSLLFLGAPRRTPSIFIYYPSVKEIRELWRSEKEKIIELSASPDKSSGFFITAAKTGTRGVMPFMNGIKLYVINNDSIITFARELGDAVQVFARWETNSAFRIFINRMNENNPSQVLQIVQIYNTYGKLFEEEQRTFNILEQGYPFPGQEEPDYSSPGNEYEFVKKSGTPDSLFFSYKAQQKKINIPFEGGILRRIAWSPDLMHAVIENSPPESTGEPFSSNLMLYSIKERKILQQWRGNTPGAFFIKNNLLIFDLGRKTKSSVVIFDLDKGEAADTITIKGGASIRTLLN